MFATLALVGLSLCAVRDGADEQYAFIAGLAGKGVHERVVKEAESFLAQYPRPEKADAARYRMACALFELHEVQRAGAEFKKLASRRGFEFEAEVAFRLGQCDLEGPWKELQAHGFGSGLHGGSPGLALPGISLAGLAGFRAAGGACGGLETVTHGPRTRPWARRAERVHARTSRR